MRSYYCICHCCHEDKIEGGVECQSEGMRPGTRDSNGILEIEAMGLSGWMPAPLPPPPSLFSALLLFIFLFSLYFSLPLFLINSLQLKKGKQVVQILSQALAGRQAVSFLEGPHIRTFVYPT